MPRAIPAGMPLSGDHFYQGQWWRHFPGGQRQPLMKTNCAWCGKPVRQPIHRAKRGVEPSCGHACAQRICIRRNGPTGRTPRSAGATRVDTQFGYVWERVDRTDFCYAMAPKKNHAGAWVQQHRLVLARYLGRPLIRGEDVHHINGVRTDNRLENLELRISPHGARQVYECACCGSRELRPVPIGRR